MKENFYSILKRSNKLKNVNRTRRSRKSNDKEKWKKKKN